MNGKFATSDFLYLTRRSLLQRSAAAGIGAGLVLGLLPGGDFGTIAQEGRQTHCGC
ncbi:twin-arginine translocation signal domain-containing protein [Sinorhizobium medicae]